MMQRIGNTKQYLH